MVKAYVYIRRDGEAWAGGRYSIREAVRLYDELLAMSPDRKITITDAIGVDITQETLFWGGGA